jgi:hypothetical protein
MQLSRPRGGVVSPFPTLRISFSFWMVADLGPHPGDPGRRPRSTLAPSPRKRTRAPGGPADRVERSSPEIRSRAAPPRSERLSSQTGVPPPRTGQNEMKPGAEIGDAGPPGVSARICGCQGAGSVSTLAGSTRTPGQGPLFQGADVVWQEWRTIPATGHQQSLDGAVWGHLTMRVLDGTACRVHVPVQSFAGRRSRLGTKKAPDDIQSRTPAARIARRPALRKPVRAPIADRTRGQSLVRN